MTMTDQQPETVEIVPVNETAIARPQQVSAALASPRDFLEDARERAEVLMEVVEERQLFATIRGRRHLQVEAWTFLGSMTGVFPHTVWTRHAPDANGEWSPPTFKKVTKTNRKGEEYEIRVVDKPGKGGWEARVEAHRADGQMVGSAETECLWDETTWESRDSHALKSMAQTRATSKALQQGLRYLAELAGFSGTPAEEMDGAARDFANDDVAYDGPVCPACAAEGKTSQVWDNRGSDKPGPVFKCKSGKSCKGYDGKYSWGAWDDDFFDGKLPDQMPSNAKPVDEYVEKHLAEAAEAGDKGSSVRLVRAKQYAMMMAADKAQNAGVLWDAAVPVLGLEADEPIAGLDDGQFRSVIAEMWQLVDREVDAAADRMIPEEDYSGYGGGY